MKIYNIFLIVSTLCSAALAIETNTNMKTATYNVLHGGTAGWLGAKEGNWIKRKQGVCDILKNMQADIYGLQEVATDNNQLDDIKKALSGHSYIGLPRNTHISQKLWQYITAAAATNEYNPIFYDKEKIELIDHDTFGINANTSTHLKLLPRICTWAHFKAKATGKDFFTYNTHLDHINQNNRIAQIKTILDHIQQHCDNKPVILMGDLNTTFTEAMQNAITNAEFTHARTIAAETNNNITTHIKKGHPAEIDHILVRPHSAFDIKSYKTCGERSKTTSDHNPVCTTFSFN